MQINLRLRLTLLLVILITTVFLFYVDSLDSRLYLKKTTFERLSEWQEDDHTAALKAFQLSCHEILKRNPESFFSANEKTGRVKDWQVICEAAKQIQHQDKATAKQFFETWFEPFFIKNNFTSHGVFTGYYLPLLHASLQKQNQYQIPIYGLPTNLVKVNLGFFHQLLIGKVITGQVKNGMVYPFPKRAEINNGAIHKTTSVIAWVDNPIDLFFAQVQGSAIVELPNHEKFLIGYAGDNGYSYTAIGKILIQQHDLNPNGISMQSIRAWLQDHPDQVMSILNRDASYVFFKTLKNNNPLGTEHVELTDGRSLAVDTHFIPLGAPLWIDTEIPQKDNPDLRKPFQHLLIAQDTGGAIKGIIRGDIYFGAGDEATFLAGHMNNRGKYWILLPKNKS